MQRVLSSREPLAAKEISFLSAGTVAPTALPITADGVTYTMAQEATWIDMQHFAVGRWDGSLSVFAFNASPTAGPLISKAANTPPFQRVQITSLPPALFPYS